MPPAKDIIKKNVKEIYINPKDYIREVSREDDSHEEYSCPNCRRGGCYYCDGNGYKVNRQGNSDLRRLFG